MSWRSWLVFGGMVGGAAAFLVQDVAGADDGDAGMGPRSVWTVSDDSGAALGPRLEESEPCDYCPDAGCQSRWTVQADALILDRVMNPTNLVGFLQDNGITGETFDFTAATGPRVAAIHHWNDELAAELNYLGIHGWHASIRQDNGPIGFVSDGFGALNAAGGWDYGSRIDSAEINLRWSPTSAVTWIVGFRYVEWAEILHGEKSPPYDSTNFTAQTNNQLYGDQIGLDCRWWDRGGPMQWNTVLKAGAYSNTAFVHNGFDAPQEGHKTAFLGEVATVGRWAIGDNWALRGGYQLMWISGIAVAPDNLGNPANGPADLSGGVLLHGAIVGIEATW